MVRDARGAEIFEGSLVSYVSTGRYPEIKIARVIETRKRVKIGQIDRLGRKPYEANNETTWVDGTSLIVVESLPEVEGRLNTRKVN